jgi:hypothetical protein
MAKDIFSREGTQFGGAFAADGGLISFAIGAGGGAPSSSLTRSAGGVGLLMQDLSFNYQQAVTRIYELGTAKTFYVAGRAQGQATCGRILGPRGVQTAFYGKYGDVCSPDNILDFSADTSCDRPASTPATPTDQRAYRFHMTGVVITSIGITVRANDMIINEQLQMFFASLELVT